MRLSLNIAIEVVKTGIKPGFNDLNDFFKYYVQKVWHTPENVDYQHQTPVCHTSF